MVQLSAATGRIVKVIAAFHLLFLSLQIGAQTVQDSTAPVLSLQRAVVTALANDPWQMGNQFTEDSYNALSVAAGSLPDPRVSVGFANVPTDSFDFNQEAMTQFKVGVTQMFPRGDSRQIKQRQMAAMGSQYPLLARDREARVTATVSRLWLAAYQANASIELIEDSRYLFQQLVDVAIGSYASAVGKTRQQDVIRAQLELIRLDDRLTQLRQTQDMSSQGLMEWLLLTPVPGQSSYTFPTSGRALFQLPSALPSIELAQSLENTASEVIQQTLLQHPAVQALDKQVAAASEGVALAKQKYKPEWGVNASYGYREDDPMGADRADFFSLGFSFDLPVFTANRQDKQLRSAVAQAEEIRTRKWLLLRRMAAELATSKAQLHHVEERKTLYRQALLPQMREQAEASLAAYTNDDGDFAEVVRARIALLNAEIELLQLQVEQQKAISQLNYLLAPQSGALTAMSVDILTDGAGEKL